MAQLDPNMPSEILHGILSLSSRQDLLQTRSVSRQWCAVSSVYLFEHQRFDVTAEVEQGFRSVLEADHLADNVRRLELNACRVRWSECREISLWLDTERSQRYEKTFGFKSASIVRDALNGLYKLKRLSALTILFDDPCRGPGSEDERDFGFDRYILANVLVPLECSRSLTTRLHHLAISKLPSINMPTLTGSYWFIDLLCNLRTLKLAMQTYQPRSARGWYRRTPAEEDISFYMTLPDTWLDPACRNLRTLYLSAERPWGWYPKVDFRHTRFPHLRNLSLENFTLSHDWQLQWLLSHSQSLQHLRMASCAVLVLADPAPQRLESDGYLIPADTDTTALGETHRRFEGRLCHYFKAFASTLNHLKLFSILDIDHFHSEAENSNGPVDREKESEQGLHFGSSYNAYILEDYLSYFTAHCPDEVTAHYPDDFEEGERREDKKQRQYSEDKQALLELFDVIEERNTVRP